MIWSTREVAVIDVRNGENVSLRYGVHGSQREHDYGVGHKPPLDALTSVISRVKECGHAFEAQECEHP